MIWKVFLVLLGTIVVLFIATQVFGAVFFPRGGADAVDIGLAFHSPLYWVMVALIFILAGWLLKLWVAVPKS